MNMPPQHMMMPPQGHFIMPAQQPPQQFHSHPQIFYNADGQRLPGNPIMHRIPTGGSTFQGNLPPFVPQQHQMQMQQAANFSKATKPEDNASGTVGKPPDSSSEASIDVSVIAPSLSEDTEPLPLPVKRERKALIYKSKDGVQFDLETLRRPRAEKIEAVVESVPPQSDLEAVGASESPSLNHESSASHLSQAVQDDNSTAASACIVTAASEVLEPSTDSYAADSISLPAVPSALSNDDLPLPSSSDDIVCDDRSVVSLSTGTDIIASVEAEVLLAEQVAPMTDEGFTSIIESIAETSTLESTPAPISLGASSTQIIDPTSSDGIVPVYDASGEGLPRTAASASEPSSDPNPSVAPLTALEEKALPSIESTFVAMVIAPPPVENEIPSFPVYITPSAVVSGKSSLIGSGTDMKNVILNKKGSSEMNQSVAVSTRSKKSQKKEMLASADAHGATADEDSMLSAYKAVSKAAEAPSESVVQSTQKVTSSETPNVEVPTVVADSKVVDSWEDTVEDVTDQSSAPVIVLEPTTKRSLRPGGGSMLFGMRMNQPPAVIRFTKQELLNLKPTSKPQLHPLPNMYVNIIGESPLSLHTSSGGSMSGKMNSNSPLWGKGKLVHSNSHHHHHQQQQPPVDSDWKRETAMSGQNKAKKVPMPKKVISDPFEVLSTECISILNKITPQTYDKLSQKILELNITNTAMLDKLIQLIFEKAVQEQSFANLYAELCNFLSKNASHWTFYTILKDVDTTDTNHFWIVDHEFSSVAAGPFFSRNDCPSAILSEVPKPMNPINVASFEIVETIVMNSIILRIYRNEKSKEYFVTYLPLNDIPLPGRSTEYFIDDKTATTDARNKYSFRARLLSTCQQEFSKTTQYDKSYYALEEERAHCYKTRDTLTETEFVNRITDIEEKQFKLKRRILGNTRFVGELYKVGLVTTNSISSCFAELLGTPGNWKPVNDEQVILCLCHLITTTGEKLDQKSANDAKSRAKLNDTYDRMRALSRDKSLNSRMRFSIEEVLNLRENKWQKRRAEEGPLKISEIHQKIVEEEARQQQEAQHTHHGSRGSKFQQSAPQAQKSILSRPKSQSQSQDVRKLSGSDAAPEQEKVLARTLSGSTHIDKPSRGGEALKRSNSEIIPRTTNDKVLVGAIATSSIQFDDTKMQNNVKSMLSEYLETNDVKEVALSLEESPKVIYGYFVLQVLDRCNNMTKMEKVAAILLLLKNSDLVTALLGAKQEIAAALFYSEQLKCLVDTTTDIKEAPERMARVISYLLRANIISTAQIQQIIEEAKQHCLEECLNSVDECDRIFNRFSSELLKDVA